MTNKKNVSLKAVELSKGIFKQKEMFAVEERELNRVIDEVFQFTREFSCVASEELGNRVHNIDVDGYFDQDDIDEMFETRDWKSYRLGDILGYLNSLGLVPKGEINIDCRW